MMPAFDSDDEAGMSDDNSTPFSPWGARKKTDGEQPRSDKPRNDKPRSDKPRSDKPRSDSPYAGKPRTDKPRSDKPRSDKPRSDSPYAGKPRSDKPRSDKPRSDKPRSDKPRSDKPRSDSPYAGKPRSDKPRSDKPRSGSPYGQRREQAAPTEPVSPLYGEKKAEGLHPSNPHQGRYDMEALVAALPALDKYLAPNPRGEQTIDFSNPKAVLCLNQAILAHHYGVTQWQIPAGYLCPPIPGRADYLQYLNDLLANGERPVKNPVPRVLDIGTGANLIYSILGTRTFGWQFTATDTDGVAVTNGHRIIAANPALQSVQLLLQRNPQQFFSGIIGADDYFELTLCNPPFFKSQQEAEAQSRRKWRNLKGEEASVKRNFGGQSNELWCEGGELAFLNRMIEESVQYGAQVGWFTALVSQQDHIPLLKRTLRTVDAQGVTVVPMAQGQKNSRFIAWHF